MTTIKLDDITFNGKSSTAYYEVVLTDNRDLGRMGGQQHRTNSWVFEANIGVVKAFAKLLIERGLKGQRDHGRQAAESVEALFNRIDREGRGEVDCLSFGVIVQPKALEIISGFSFAAPRTVVVRETVS